MAAMVGHWHVASGLAGYGPDGSDGYSTATTWRMLADLIRVEVRQAGEYEFDGSAALAEAEDYKAAWFARKRSDEMDSLAANFDNGRADAPLYKDDPDAWDATIKRLAEEHFPYDYDITDHGPRLRVYAWACEAPDCDHLAESDDD